MLSALVENPRETLLDMGLADQDIEAVVMYIGQMRGQLDTTNTPQAGSWWA